MKKKILMLILIFAIVLPSLLCGCTKIESHIVEFETEYFICERYDDSAVTIKGLTEKGREQEELVIPRRLDDGQLVDQLGKRGKKIEFYSRNLKKLFWSRRIGYSRSNLFDGTVPNMTKLIFLSAQPNFDCPTTTALGSSHVYAPKNFYDSYVSYGYTNILKCNISYFSNDKDYSNGGYHWVDDLDFGEKIKTIPPDPVREFYTFGGWYFEQECVNAIDFATYVKGENDLDLYAKWTRI